MRAFSAKIVFLFVYRTANGTRNVLLRPRGQNHQRIRTVKVEYLVARVVCIQKLTVIGLSAENFSAYSLAFGCNDMQI